jgi:cell wall assembly regulator SMI1
MDIENFWKDPYTDSNYCVGPPLTDEMIREAEEELGYRLPGSYIRLLRIKNGGELKKSCFPTTIPRSWAKDHIAITSIMNIGGKGNSIIGKRGSQYLIKEWSYPNVGVLVADCPSAGHDVVMLDYSECGPQGEPRVIHVDQEADDEPEVIVLASSFEEFLLGLVDCSQFDHDFEDPIVISS